MITMPEMRQLRYFAAVAEELHFGRAARRLNIVQPALSMQIKALEEDLGATLFLRDRHKVQLTVAGEIFRHEVDDILARMERAVRMVRRADQGEVGRLGIGMSATAASIAILPKIVRAFHKLSPEVQVDLAEIHPAGQVKALLEGDVDLVFGPSEAFVRVGKAVSGLYLNHFAFKLACSVEHRLAKLGKVHVDDLRRETFVGLAATEDRHGMQVTAYALPFLPLNTMRVLSPAALFSVVEANLAVAVLSEALERNAPPQVTFLDLEGVSSNMDLYLYSRTGDHSTLVAHFLRVSQQIMAEEIKENDPPD